MNDVLQIEKFNPTVIELIAKDKKYKALLKDCGWTKENSEDFIIKNSQITGLVKVFKKIAEINL